MPAPFVGGDRLRPYVFIFPGFLEGGRKMFSEDRIEDRLGEFRPAATPPGLRDRVLGPAKAELGRRGKGRRISLPERIFASRVFWAAMAASFLLLVLGNMGLDSLHQRYISELSWSRAVPGYDEVGDFARDIAEETGIDPAWIRCRHVICEGPAHEAGDFEMRRELMREFLSGGGIGGNGG